MAEQAQADDALVAAAFLHDIGHRIGEPVDEYTFDDLHELRGAVLLSVAFRSAVVEPVRLHVQAKRYLVSTQSTYLASLRPAALHSLRLQGGVMSSEECRIFEAMPFAADALALRRWDDAARHAGLKTPPLDHYLSLLRTPQRCAAPPPFESLRNVQ